MDESPRKAAIAISFAVRRDAFAAFPTQGITFDLSNEGAEDPGSTETTTVEAARGSGVPIFVVAPAATDAGSASMVSRGVCGRHRHRSKGCTSHSLSVTRFASGSSICGRNPTVYDRPTSDNCKIQLFSGSPVLTNSVSLLMCFEGTAFNALFVRSPLTDLFRLRISNLNPLVVPTMSETDSHCVLIIISHSTSKSGAFNLVLPFWSASRTGRALPSWVLARKISRICRIDLMRKRSISFGDGGSASSKPPPPSVALLREGERNAKEGLAKHKTYSLSAARSHQGLMAKNLRSSSLT